MHAILRICVGDHNQSETNNARTVTDRTTECPWRLIRRLAMHLISAFVMIVLSLCFVYFAMLFVIVLRHVMRSLFSGVFAFSIDSTATTQREYLPQWCCLFSETQNLDFFLL